MATTPAPNVMSERGAEVKAELIATNTIEAIQVITDKGDTAIGRPSKFTPDRVLKIIKITIMAPSNHVAIAQACGIGVSILYGWLSRGRAARDMIEKTDKAGGQGAIPEESEMPYLEFVEAFEEASVQAELIAERRILRAGERDWRAAAWYLERRRRDLYARTTGAPEPSDGGTDPNTVTEITDTDRADRFRALILSVIDAGKRPEDIGLPPMKQVGESHLPR